MADYTVTSTTDQDRALAFFVGKGQAPTAAALVQAIASQRLNDLVTRAKETLASDVGARVAKAPDATLGRIVAILDEDGVPV